METDKKEKVEIRQDYGFAFLDQIKAAPYTHEVIRKLDAEGNLDASLLAVKETDVFRLRRGLCLPSAAASSINWVLGSRVIGDEDGHLKIGDLYRILLRFHGRKSFSSGENYPHLKNGWLFATEQGDVYHHAIVAFARGMGLEAESVIGITSIDIFRDLLAKGGAVAISLDNNFVLEQTLGNSPDLVKRGGEKPQILIEGADGLEYRNFENGRHVIGLLAIEDDTAIVTDSFRLPQMEAEEPVMRIPLSEVDKYLAYTTGGKARGIVFSKNKGDFETVKQFISPTSVPQEVVDRVRQSL